MDLTGNVILNAYSVLLLAVLYVQSTRHGEKDSLQNRLFAFEMLATAFLLALDIFSRLDGNPGSISSVLNRWGNFIVFLFNPVLPACWLLYAHFQVFRDEKRLLRLLWPIGAVCLVNAALTVLTLFFGWYYAIDAGNIYHRGPLFWVPVAIMVAMVSITYLMLVSHRANVEKKYYLTLMFFAVPPLICVALQILFYGWSLMLNGVVFSLLIVFLNIRNDSMYKDYLTGVNNRKKLELHLKERISASTERNTFSEILIDLDNFKAINDAYGHAVGDEALESVAKLMKSCLRRNDFLARFGGDEFCAILDISSEDDLGAAVGRIKDSLAKYNESSGKPYTLGFSMGYAVYDARKHPKASEFQRMIDSLMYENKRAKKASI